MPDDLLTVRDIMTTALITLSASDTVKHADIDMKLASIRHIPVVDEHNHLTGILSNRDVLRALGGTFGERGDDGERGDGDDGDDGVGDLRDGLVIGAIMTRRVHSVREDAPAHEAAELMIEHKIGAIPVIGDDEQLVGLVTETDFVRIARDYLAGQ